MPICECCNNTILPTDSFVFTRTGEVHYNCANANNYAQCEVCGNYAPYNDGIVMDGRFVCDTCNERGVAICDRCGDVVRESAMYDVISDGLTVTWCESCADYHSTTCNECGNRYDDDDIDEDGLCPDCARNNLPHNIDEWIPARGRMGYYYNPKAHFAPKYEEDQIFLGFELECDGHGIDSDDLHEVCTSVSKTAGYVYCKRDGSIGSHDGEDSMEIVSHPATLKYHMDKKDVWKDVFGYLIDQGFDSHNSGTCGLHVHASLAAIEKQNPYAVHNILILVDRFWENIKRFARRTDAQLNRWAQRYAAKNSISKNIKPEYVYQQDQKGHDGRYMAVNLMTGKDHNGHCTVDGAKTIEFRLFRGTLNLETFYATLQFVKVLIDKAIEIGSDADAVQSITWDELVREDYIELNNYLKRRGLYEDPNEEVCDDPDDVCELEQMVQQVAPGYGSRCVTGTPVIVRINENDEFYPPEMRGGCVLNGMIFCNMFGSTDTIVEFPTYYPGMHDCSGRIASGRGLYVKREDIISNRNDGIIDIGKKCEFDDPDGGITTGVIVDKIDLYYLIKCEGKSQPWMHRGGIYINERKYYYIHKSSARIPKMDIVAEDVSRIVKIGNNPRYNNSGRVPDDYVPHFGDRVALCYPPQRSTSDSCAGYGVNYTEVFDDTITGTIIDVSRVDLFCLDSIRERSTAFVTVLLNDPNGYCENRIEINLNSIIFIGENDCNHSSAMCRAEDIISGWYDYRWSNNTCVEFDIIQYKQYADQIVGRLKNGRYITLSKDKAFIRDTGEVVSSYIRNLH